MTTAFEASILPTRRLHLEPLTEDHAAKMFDGRQDPVAYRHIPENPPGSLEELTARYRRLEPRRSPDGEEAWLNWALIDPNGEPHGYLQATVQLASKEAWIAYFVFPSSQRRGYASEALYALLPALRDAYGIQRFNAEIDTRNVASIRLVESLGFVLVEHVKNADEFKGSTSDEFHYALAGLPRCPPQCRSNGQ
ncbi:GNAT family protein [Paraburkholderia sp. J12]|uniref:GNAT family N-acetyltransferase n=1 Tax=Paraburkholderia sp. J12 TaxID=2805432 RepID=UPI002ABD6677|nr:GNAT family protein [Paraburkholderia sp. J12]